MFKTLGIFLHISLNSSEYDQSKCIQLTSIKQSPYLTYIYWYSDDPKGLWAFYLIVIHWMDKETKALRRQNDANLNYDFMALCGVKGLNVTMGQIIYVYITILLRLHHLHM